VQDFEVEPDVLRFLVSSKTIRSWVAATIEAVGPLIHMERNVEGVTQEIIEELSPVISFVFIQNHVKVKAQVSAICQKAARLKLAMRKASRVYAIEVPSHDVETWGGPGCDLATRALKPRQ
jgi:hypothetical protein